MTRTLLSIESSTDWLSVALLRGEEILVLRENEDGRQHASALLPTIDAVLGEAGIGLGDLDAIGIATGPGSFTSLRIGLATVKGLGFGRDIEGVGVSTLEAMALSALEGEGSSVPGQVIPILDARRGEWYAGGWRRAKDTLGLPVATLAEGLYAPAQLASDLASGPASDIASDIASDNATAMASAMGEGSTLMTPEVGEWKLDFEAAGIGVGNAIEGRVARPRADWVGRLAQRRLEAGEGMPVSMLEARYLRRAEAEAKRLGGPVEAGEIARVDPDRG